jgi:transcriptional regulator with GAF, ATPase, and Fis domain
LFLDEVADLPAPVQAQLVRVIQERVYERVGGAGVLLRADVRLIAATHKDLRHEVEAGRFREDLYFRLNTFPIHIPPLRERPGDVSVLAVHLLRRISKDLDLPQLAMGPAAVRTLEQHRWPGNVRELRNVLERAAILAQGQTIQSKHLNLDTPGGHPAPAPVGSVRPTDPRISHSLNRLDAAIAAEVLRALDEAGGKVAGDGGAAVKLGMPPTTLHSLMKRLGVRRQGQAAR